MEDLARLGLGLDYGTVRLCRAEQAWVRAGKNLRDQVASALPRHVIAVEHIGSSSVPGLLSKPIIDLAIGVDGHK